MQDDKYYLVREGGIDKKVHPFTFVYHYRIFVGKYNANDTEYAIYLWCLLQRKLLCSTP